jgi:ribosomal protein L11 methyltransferase
VLVPLAAALRAELRPSGTLIASGIFIDREDEVRTAFESAGLGIAVRMLEGDWVALIARAHGEGDRG